MQITNEHFSLINPRRMRRMVAVVILRVSVCYISRLYVSCVAWRDSQFMAFSRFFWPPLPSASNSWVYILAIHKPRLLATTQHKLQTLGTGRKFGATPPYDRHRRSVGRIQVGCSGCSSTPLSSGSIVCSWYSDSTAPAPLLLLVSI